MVGIAKSVFIVKCAFVASLIGGGTTARAGDVAHVMAVNGFVLAGTSGRQVALDVLDGIRDRTRVDVQANSEVQLCHYESRTLLTVKGPASATVSATGLTEESGNAVRRSSGPCAAPQAASVQGGHLSRAPVRRD
jgi:hypothetical protein